jgi:hypothetical protein
MRQNGRVTRAVTPAAGRAVPRAAKLDQTCAEAIGVARSALSEVDRDHVGEHLSAVAEGERVVTHLFECKLPGYRGWRWAVTVTRVSRSRHVTVCEAALLPGPDALLAPEWVPWQERLRPGDLGVGDLLPTEPDDERLVPGYVPRPPSRSPRRATPGAVVAASTCPWPVPCGSPSASAATCTPPMTGRS